jgi:hypothetical protein
LQLKAQRERASQLQRKAQQVLQFTCFTSTKVQILTQKGASEEGVAALRTTILELQRERDAARGEEEAVAALVAALRTTILELQRERDAAQGAAGAQFTCFTST